MSRGRRQMIQLNEPARVLYSNEPTHDLEDDDDDSAGDMPTPERLVTDDMIPNRDGSGVGQGRPFEIDNKVANFLAEIDALDSTSQDAESTLSPGPGPGPGPGPAPAPVRHSDVSGPGPVPVRHGELSPVRREYSPVRDKSPVRSKHNAYSNMFVKGTPEFVHKPDEKKMISGSKQIEPWPEEPKTDWQQLKDESTNYPYYWNTVTNAVVWDMPPEFSQYLLRQKEYEEKVERGLREGTLDPERKMKKDSEKETTLKVAPSEEKSTELKQSNEHKSRHYSDESADSSSDSTDSDSPKHYYKNKDKNKKNDKSHEVSSSSADHRKPKRSLTPELPDSTKSEDNKKEPRAPAGVDKADADDSIDFDIDDIDKELELALERKRQELMKLEEKKGEDKADEGDKSKRKDKKKDDRRHRDDDRRDERRHKHGKHRDSDRKHSEDSKEEKKPKLTLKERLRIEMELKLEKERRKKKAIEDLMARELEQTVGGRSHKRSRDDKDKPHKHYYHDDGRGDRRGSRDDYRDYDRGYDTWMDRGPRMYDDRFVPPPLMKPPPPTDEMIAYEEERRAQLVDYGHGSRSRPFEGDSDGDESRSADFREMEVKKLEALQLAELALSKLEFLEVTKKGLSKLQILLIELETRHQDWQSGGLTTNHFLTKLKEANWQLEQYEASAPPPGWVCCWDRDYRRYFYTHKLTGKNQWDYPDADDIRIEEEQAKDFKKKTLVGRTQEPDTSEISSTSDKGKSQFMEKEILASMSLPPPPPPPAEEHPSVKSLQLMYGSSSDSESEEPNPKKAKKVSEATLLQNVPLPPEESHKKERHKKKKKKEKSKHKDKDKEKSEPGIVGPVGPIYPTISCQPPPPPPESDTSSQQPVTMATLEQPNTSEVPVYGTFNDQTGQNDQPLEFGTVPETDPVTEGMEGIETSTISQGPQINHPVSYEDPYLSVQGQAETSTSTEQVNEVTHGESSHDTTASAQTSAADDKKKKKKEKMGTGSISLKKKHVSSMVQKWQKVKKEVELEEQHRQIREAEIRRKLAELE